MTNTESGCFGQSRSDGTRTSPGSNGRTQDVLVEIWKEVLRTKEVDIKSDFLDLGGDSLAALSCISRVRSVLGYELVFDDFFFGQATILMFSAIIDQWRDLDLSRAGANRSE